MLGAILGLLAGAGTPLFAQSPPQLTWGAGGAGGSGTWDTSTLDWYNGAANVPWTNGDSTVFGGTAGMVSISSSVTANKVTFTTPGYTVQNSFLEGASSGLTVETDADATISSSIFGASPYTTAFTKTGAGVLTLTGQGPVFFGSVTISAGEVRFTGSGSPNFTTPFVLANAAGTALTFAASTNTVASLAGGGANGGVVRPNVSSGNLSLAINGSADATFAGLLQDNGSATLALQKNGASTQTLSGANTYSGATTINAGALVLGGANGSALNTASVSVAAGSTLLLDNSSAASNNRLSNAVPVSLSGGTLGLIGNATTDSKQSLGTLSFSRASSVSVAPSGTAAAQLTFSGLARQSNGTISFSGGSNIGVTGLTNVNGIVGGYATVGADWASVDANARIFAYNGYVTSLATAGGQDNLRLTSAGGDTTALPQTKAVNSLNLINSGTTAPGTLDLGAGQKLTLTSSGLLESGGAGHVIQNGTLTTSGSELIVTDQAALTIASTVANTSPAVTLTKSGAGTLVLTGANTYTGPTVIDQGIVRAAVDNNLGAGSAVVLAGGTLQAAAGFTSAKSLQGSGGTLDTAGFNVAFNGGNNTAGVTKTGAGMLSLTGTVGSVSVNAGLLHLSSLATNNAASIFLAGGRLEASGSGVSQVQTVGPSAEISPGGLGQAATLTLGTLMASGLAVIDFDLGSTASDLLTISSGLSLSGSPLLFRFSDLGGTRTGTAYTLMNLPSFNLGMPLSAASFGIDPASTASGYQGMFSLVNNTLSVTFTSVPEPRAAVWVLVALGLWGIRLRFGRKWQHGSSR